MADNINIFFHKTNKKKHLEHLPENIYKCKNVIKNETDYNLVHLKQDIQ